MVFSATLPSRFFDSLYPCSFFGNLNMLLYVAKVKQVCYLIDTEDGTHMIKRVVVLFMSQLGQRFTSMGFFELEILNATSLDSSRMPNWS